jgi:general nucleoside transport system ATP-binding protein
MSSEANALVKGPAPGVPRLQLTGITKQYPAVRANDGVNLSVLPGEIHAVLGENGAGKSTLMKIIVGAVQPDAGEMQFDGQPVRVASPRAARRLGISMVHQHFSLFDTLTVAQNVWLGLDRGPTLAEVTQRITTVAQRYGLPLEPQRPVHSLSVGERQRVEIVRALLTAPRLLILDEPTSVLTPQAVRALFVTLRQLAEGGTSILYISHKLDEIRSLCQHCTVLRGGRVTGEVDPRQQSNASLSRLMVGAEPTALRRAPALGSAGDAVLGASRSPSPALQVQALALAAEQPFGTTLQGIHFSVQAGEILGVAGVSGNGQQELLAALSGEDHRAPPEAIQLFGQAVGSQKPRQRRAAGLHFVPEERLGRGAVPSLSLAHNTLLTRSEGVGAGGWLRMPEITSRAQAIIARFGVKAAGPQALARSLSGGNLQKFLIGREIDANPRVLIVSQPTWGVDVSAAAHIRNELLALRDAGCALLLVSEELDELLALSDRVVVMAQGQMSPALPVANATVELLGQWMAGLWPRGLSGGTASDSGAGEASLIASAAAHETAGRAAVNKGPCAAP